MKKNVQTPKGTFPIFSSQMSDGFYVATVIYFLHQDTDPSNDSVIGAIEFKHQVQHATTEDQALNDLLEWCELTFGTPCKLS